MAVMAVMGWSIARLWRRLLGWGRALRVVYARWMRKESCVRCQLRVDKHDDEMGCPAHCQCRQCSKLEKGHARAFNVRVKYQL